LPLVACRLALPQRLPGPRQRISWLWRTRDERCIESDSSL
jgi:hypothetical protein